MTSQAVCGDENITTYLLLWLYYLYITAVISFIWLLIIYNILYIATYLSAIYHNNFFRLNLKLK